MSQEIELLQDLMSNKLMHRPFLKCYGSLSSTLKDKAVAIEIANIIQFMPTFALELIISRKTEEQIFWLLCLNFEYLHQNCTRH